MKRLILAGGGHAHLHLMKSLASQRWPGVEIILVTPYARQIYSGMVPGWMAGHYTLEQCAAAIEPLAAAAGITVHRAGVVAVESGKRSIRTSTGLMLEYDALSLDTGATIDLSCLAASGTLTVPVRPLEQFVVNWENLLGTARYQGSCRLAVVGGGAAGVELAMAAHYRLCREIGENSVRVTLLLGNGLLPRHGQRIRRKVAASLVDRGIALIEHRAAGCPEGLILDDGTALPVDASLAATGVRPPVWLKDSGLALAADGFVAIGKGQQSISHPEIFAGGDVASRVDHPHAKSGVYAVRAGPVLTHNLYRHLHCQPLLPYVPQRRSLYLLATGPKEAIMSWSGLTARGHWVWCWKDWLDRRFMRQYQRMSAASRGENHGTAQGNRATVR
jgi:pyridine nucleotide-disulfide oxidoreductase family protein